MSKQYQPTVTAADGTTIKEFTPYPTIRVVTSMGQFKKSLATSGLRSVADVAGADLAREWEKELFDCLETLQNSTWTAKALLAEINRVGSAKRLKVTIWPREYCAANLITNIAMSENNPSGDLRYGEVGFKRMPAQYKTSDGYLTSSEHTSLIRKMCQTDPCFAAPSPLPHT
jgi:hypothetical protein